MLFLFTIFIFFSVIVSAAILLKRRKNLRLLNSPKNELKPPVRSLFEPDEEEFRAAERGEKSRLAAAAAKARTEENDRTKVEAVRQCEAACSSSPSVKSAVELLHAAAQSNRGELFAAAAQSVLKIWRRGEIAGLSAENLAQMLESHFWLLPQQERTSGLSYRLKQETAELRAKSEVHSGNPENLSDSSVN